MTRNLAASVRARLKQHADAAKEDFNLTLTHYGLERLLYVFATAAIKGAEIRKSSGYGGVRIDILATLDGARIALQVDIGFGDAVTPAPEEIRYPVLLDDLPAPQLRAYPKHTVVAEKFHAICLLGMTNTRMKDYFDLGILMQESTLDVDELRRAIEATFARRQTALPAEMPSGLSDAFVSDPTKQAQWKAFLRKNRLTPVDLGDLVARLRSRLQAVGVL